MEDGTAGSAHAPAGQRRINTSHAPSSAPAGAGRQKEGSRFHGFRVGRLRRRAAPPVATHRRSSRAKWAGRNSPSAGEMIHGEAPMTNQVRMTNDERRVAWVGTPTRGCAEGGHGPEYRPMPPAGVLVSGLVIDWSLGLGHSSCHRSRADCQSRPNEQRPPPSIIAIDLLEGWASSAAPGMRSSSLKDAGQGLRA